MNIGKEIEFEILKYCDFETLAQSRRCSRLFKTWIDNISTFSQRVIDTFVYWTHVLDDNNFIINAFLKGTIMFGNYSFLLHIIQNLSLRGIDPSLKQWNSAIAQYAIEHGDMKLYRCSKYFCCAGKCNVTPHKLVKTLYDNNLSTAHEICRHNLKASRSAAECLLAINHGHETFALEILNPFTYSSKELNDIWAAAIYKNHDRIIKIFSQEWQSKRVSASWEISRDVFKAILIKRRQDLLALFPSFKTDKEFRAVWLFIARSGTIPEVASAIKDSLLKGDNPTLWSYLLLHAVKGENKPVYDYCYALGGRLSTNIFVLLCSMIETISITVFDHLLVDIKKMDKWDMGLLCYHIIRTQRLDLLRHWVEVRSFEITTVVWTTNWDINFYILNSTYKPDPKMDWDQLMLKAAETDRPELVMLFHSLGGTMIDECLTRATCKGHFRVCKLLKQWKNIDADITKMTRLVSFYVAHQLWSYSHTWITKLHRDPLTDPVD